MINILIDNDYLDLFADTQVSVDFSSNNLGSEDGSFVTYSESVEIPLTDRNASIFQINKADKTIGRRLSIGKIINEGEVIMSVTCEVQSVEIDSLEEKISLLVMDAVSGILKDLKKKKLDIVFDKAVNDGFYFKRNISNISNKLYKYGFVETNGYNASINPSDTTKFVYTSRIKDDAVPRIVFNVNECFSRIFKNYGLDCNQMFDEDYFTTIPYKDLTGKNVVSIKGAYNANFKAPALQLRAIGQDALRPEQEAMNKLVRNIDCLSQFYSTLQTDFIKIEDIAKASGADGLDGKFISYYSGFFNSGEYVLSATNLEYLVGSKFMYSLPDNDLEKNFMYTSVTDAELFITVKETFNSIYKSIPVASLKITPDCKISSVTPNEEFLYSGKFSVRSSESFSIFFSIRFKGNGCFYQINNETINISLGSIQAYKPMFLVLKTRPELSMSPEISLAPVKKEQKSNVNDVLCLDGFYEDRLKSFNLGRYNEIVSQIESTMETPDKYIRDIVSIQASLKEADITAYDFITEQCKRFNKKLIISDGIVSETSVYNSEIIIIDELNSEYTVTPKDFESEIRSVKVKNKSFNTKYDKIYNGDGAFDSDEIVVNEDNQTNKTIQLKSAPIPDMVIGDGYAVNEGQSELVNKFGMIATGTPQVRLVGSKEMDYRVGYTANIATNCISVHSQMYGGIILDVNGNIIDKEDIAESIMYTTENNFLMKAVASDILGDVEFTIPAIIYKDTSFSLEPTEIGLKARHNCGIICVELPSGDNISILMKLTSVNELLDHRFNDGTKLTNTLYNKLPLFNIYDIDDTVKRSEYDKSAVCTVINKGMNLDMKITITGKSDADNRSRICIPIVTNDMTVSTTLSDSDLSKTYPAMIPFKEERFIGYDSVATFSSNNTKYSLSFNNLTAKGKLNALDRFFKDSILMISGDANPYVSVEIMTTVEDAKRIISGANLNIRGVLYKVVEASDINLGDKSIVKMKLTR